MLYFSYGVISNTSQHLFLTLDVLYEVVKNESSQISPTDDSFTVTERMVPLLWGHLADTMSINESNIINECDY